MADIDSSTRKSLYLFSPSLSEAGRGAFYREGDAGQGSTVDVEPPKPPPATVGPEEYRAALMFNLPPEYVEAFDKRIAAGGYIFLRLYCT